MRWTFATINGDHLLHYFNHLLQRSLTVVFSPCLNRIQRWRRSSIACFCIQQSSSKEPHYIVFSPCINRIHNYTDHLLHSTICFKRIPLYSFQSLAPFFPINSLCQSYTTIDQTHIFSNKHGTCALTPSVQLIFVLLLLLHVCRDYHH